MEKFYTVSKNKTYRWLRLKSWTAYCKIQILIEKVGKTTRPSVQFSCSVVSNSLQPHGLQHTRPPCPTPTPGVYSHMSTESVMPSNHLILCRPLLLLGRGRTAINKASGCYGTSVELFKPLKDDAIRVLHSPCQEIWRTQKWPQDWKRAIFIPIPKRVVLKNVLTIGQLHSSPILVRLCLKSCILGFSNMRSKNFQRSKLNLEKAKEPEIKLPTYTAS